MLDRYQDPAHQVRIAGVLNVAADGHDRDLIGGGVEVARDDDLGVGVGVEDLVDEPADLQGLRHPFHRGYEGALGPGVGGSPGVAVDLLAGDVGRDLRLQVHVDHMQPGPVGQVELHVQDGPLDTDRDRGGIGWIGGEAPIGRAWSTRSLRSCWTLKTGNVVATTRFRSSYTSLLAVRVLASWAPARLVPVSSSVSASSDLGWLGRSWPLTSWKQTMSARSRTICGRMSGSARPATAIHPTAVSSKFSRLNVAIRTSAIERPLSPHRPAALLATRAAIWPAACRSWPAPRTRQTDRAGWCASIPGSVHRRLSHGDVARSPASSGRPLGRAQESSSGLRYSAPAMFASV